MIDLSKRPKIVMAEQDLVAVYEKGLRHFLKHMLDLNFDECFISDMSSLSDFYGIYGEYEQVPDDSLVQRPLVEFDTLILYRVWAMYGVLFDKVTIPLGDMISEIEKVYDFDTDTKKQPVQH